jgi:hypothetical protein
MPIAMIFAQSIATVGCRMYPSLDLTALIVEEELVSKPRDERIQQRFLSLEIDPAVREQCRLLRDLHTALQL